MTNGSTVAAFERVLADYCSAKHAIAMTNGTVTLQVALMALNIKRVVVPPLTMGATTIAALNAGCEVVFSDVDPMTWTLKINHDSCNMPVSLYGLGVPWCGSADIDDAAQTLRQHSGAAFTSLSFQRSKILNTGEGGALLTNNDAFAHEAREIASLGYRLRPGESRIESTALKSPDYARHYRSASINARMNDLTAADALRRINGSARYLDECLAARRYCAALYQAVIEGCEWLTPQFVPDGWTHDYWAFAVATDTPERNRLLADAVVAHGGERPYGAWRLTYDEPAFKYLLGRPREQYTERAGSVIGQDSFGPVYRMEPLEIPAVSVCPVAESLQPRLLQFQTNNLASAAQNAKALRAAIQDVS